MTSFIATEYHALKNFLIGAEKTAEADALAFISGSYNILISVLKKVGSADLKALEVGMLAAAETAFARATGTLLQRIQGAGLAALTAGTALLAGDLIEAFKEVTDAEKANLLHALSTSKATEASAGVAA